MTIKKRGRKNISSEMKSGFGAALAGLTLLEPKPRIKKDSATDLIIAHRSEISGLIDLGFSVEQIVGQLAKIINLEITSKTILKALRTNDDNKSKVRKIGKQTVQGVKKPADKPVETAPVPDVKPESVTVEAPVNKPVDAPYRPYVEAPEEDQNVEPKKRRGPIVVDDEL